MQATVSIYRTCSKYFYNEPYKLVDASVHVAYEFLWYIWTKWFCIPSRDGEITRYPIIGRTFNKTAALQAIVAIHICLDGKWCVFLYHGTDLRWQWMQSLFSTLMGGSIRIYILQCNSSSSMWQNVELPPFESAIYNTKTITRGA